MTTVLEDLKRPSNQDFARLMYNNGVSGILVSIITSTFLVFAIGKDISAFKSSWWFLMMLVLGLRLADLFWWKQKIQHSHFDGDYWLRRFILGVNTTALLWSSYAVYVILGGDLLETTAAIIAIASMAGGSATVLAPHKKTAMFYAVILLLPASICLMFLSESAHLVLGILGVCFSLVMMIVSKKAADFTQDAVRLKNENAVLVEQMERKVEERTRQLYELSNIDPLTKLYNRNAFLKNLKSAMQRCQEKNETLALLFIDLDGFKKINDTFGHDAGDHILRESASRLKATVHQNSELCRWGGDEFLVFFQNVNDVEVYQKAEAIIESISQTHHWDDIALSVSATVGIARFPEHAAEDSLLIQYADTAMYFQKKQAPSQVCVFDRSMAERHAEELRLKNGLAQAIELEQLRLVYQPIVSAEDGRPVAMEALLRWQFDDQNIPPDQFIAVAEQYSLIQKIGLWVLDKACHEAAGWPEKLSLPVCINVSIIQLQDAAFVNQVREVVARSGIDPKRVNLEITESVFATDKQAVSDKIKALQAEGIRVSIDDFGTGYSSLSVMQDLAVNTVKIDRAFINKIDSSGFAIVTAVIHASGFLKFEVVAEGVETQEQRVKLANIGVQKLQGFFFSRPLERDQLADYFAQF